MNILPKKRWHVRTKENIARVRRDEAKAAEEQKIKEARAQKAEAESRINFLRDQARSQYDGRASTEEGTSSSKLEHVNFFADLEDGKIDYNRPNAEHEKEKKEEREKYEKQIGYLTYLGQNTNESTGKKSWYEELPTRLTDTEKDIEVEILKKALNDPIRDIKKYLNIMSTSSKEKPVEIKTESNNRKRKKSESEDSIISDSKSSSSKKKHKHKKSKKHKKRKHHSREKYEVKTSDSDIQKLKAERLLREQSERLRAEALIAKLKGNPVPVVAPEAPKPGIKQKYNSQFFPEIARQNAGRTPNVHALRGS